MRLRSRARNGFSIAELAIVILLLSILFTVMFGAYYATGRIARESSPRSQARARALLALNLVQSSLNQAFYIENVKGLVFVGRHLGNAGRESDIVTFATVIPGSESTGTSAVREVSYYVKRPRDNPSGPGILMRREDQGIDQDPYKGGYHFHVLEDVQAFHLSYSQNGKDWVETWNSADSHRFPRLIRVELIVGKADRAERFETLASPGLFQN